jgi:hypothetical protein
MISLLSTSTGYSPPPHGLRHPQIFYYGHTACLYVNKLRLNGVLSKPVNAYFESIFEIGVDEMVSYFGFAARFDSYILYWQTGNSQVNFFLYSCGMT